MLNIFSPISFRMIYGIELRANVGVNQLYLLVPSLWTLYEAHVYYMFVKLSYPLYG